MEKNQSSKSQMNRVATIGMFDGVHKGHQFVLHQANLRIIEAIAKRLHVGMEHFPYNVDRVGNTSSAAIPLLLDELNKSGRIQKGQLLVLSGFGAGLTYGACVVRW